MMNQIAHFLIVLALIHQPFYKTQTRAYHASYELLRFKMISQKSTAPITCYHNCLLIKRGSAWHRMMSDGWTCHYDEDQKQHLELSYGHKTFYISLPASFYTKNSRTSRSKSSTNTSLD